MAPEGSVAAARWHRASRGSPGGWHQELDDFACALSGAFLFGAPLLYTMEMWDLGARITGWRLLAFLLVALISSAGLAYAAGFRRHTDGSGERASLGQSVEQAIDAVAVGAVGSVLVLLALNRLGAGDPLGRTLGMIIVQAVPLGLGVSVASAVFARGGRQGDHDQRPPVGAWQATLVDVGATMIAGTFIAFSIVPTEEVTLLAGGLTYGHKLALIALSLCTTYAIVFASGFDPEHDRRPSGVFQHPLSETVMAYLVSLLISAGALFFFDRLHLDDLLGHAISQTLVLAFPAAIGGAAGRLVV